MNWTLVSAVNDEDLLTSCLLRSPDADAATEIMLQRGYANAADAYNAAIAAAKTDLVVFVHQDVYLPAGWIEGVLRELEFISAHDPLWGVVGVWGERGGCAEPAGHVYDGGWRQVLGSKFRGGVEVESLDELVLILRRSTGLRFDPTVPGFHMYGTDICQEARRRGRRCYAIAAFCIHNTRQHGMLPWQFWKAYLVMRKKWRAQLPIRTSCTRITRGCWPMIRWNVVRAINLATGRDERPLDRVADPVETYDDLIRRGAVRPPRTDDEDLRPPHHAPVGPTAGCE
jgi:hypothetical protein